MLYIRISRFVFSYFASTRWQTKSFPGCRFAAEDQKKIFDFN